MRTVIAQVSHDKFGEAAIKQGKVLINQVTTELELMYALDNEMRVKLAFPDNVEGGEVEKMIMRLEKTYLVKELIDGEYLVSYPNTVHAEALIENELSRMY